MTRELADQVKRLAELQVETVQSIGSTMDRHDREMSELRQAQIVTERSLARLSDTVERFIRGGENGKH